jgi:iron only hydrogenase large subunit-like protein
VYGFRNIQTVVRQLKRGACPYDYVEIMACPSGCLNGGGQPKPVAGQSARQALEAAERMYGGEGSGVVEREAGAHCLVGQVYEWLGGGVGSAEAASALHTRFHAREATVTAQLNNW